GFALSSHLKARRLPLRRTRVYVPNGGWSELEGEFGGALDYVLETGGRNEGRGQITIDGLTVDGPFLEGPGLAGKRPAVRTDPVDRAGPRAVVRGSALDNSYLVAGARGGVVSPSTEKVVPGEPPQPRRGDPEPAQAAAPPPDPPPAHEEAPPPPPPPPA